MRQDGKKFQFENYTEFIEYAKAHPCRISTDTYTDGWSGRDAVTYEQALNLAERGWSNGRQAIRTIVDKLNIAGHVHKQEIINDVVGDCWDMGRVISGIPECAMAWEQTEDMQDTGNILHIAINTVVSAGINESIIRARGAAILALIESLETGGKRVGITMLFAGNGYHVEIPVKQPGESMQDDLIAFTIAHPAFFRRFGHALTGSGIMPADTKIECDIYIPMMMLGEEQWKSETNTLNWIKEYLKKYGVKYE